MYRMVTNTNMRNHLAWKVFAAAISLFHFWRFLITIDWYLDTTLFHDYLKHEYKPFALKMHGFEQMISNTMGIVVIIGNYAIDFPLQLVSAMLGGFGFSNKKPHFKINSTLYVLRIFRHFVITHIQILK